LVPWNEIGFRVGYIQGRCLADSPRFVPLSISLWRECPKEGALHMIEGVSRFDPERTQQIWATAVDFVFLERDEFIRRRSKRWISRMARIERTSLRNAAFVHRRIAKRRFERDNETRSQRRAGDKGALPRSRSDLPAPRQLFQLAAPARGTADRTNEQIAARLAGCGKTPRAVSNPPVRARSGHGGFFRNLLCAS
jgi:hypothetical protein